ncbi:TatD family hydrolase [Romboutsia sp.]|uniref:TatD family hydrolase n=1 Tax=Romboutsia sp. TaxID=1965302 RepID=UPI003F2C2D8B
MYIDFHNHIDFYNKVNIDKVINDINQNKIKTIACAMDEESYLYNKKLQSKSEYIIPTYGIHPWKAYENRKNLHKVQMHIKESKIIGEVGLDFHWIEDTNTYPYQIEVFEQFLKYAKEYNKYINLHTKGAEEIVLDLIKKYDVSNQSIIHWYSGEKDTLEKLIDAKCNFTISVDVGYSKKTEEIIKIVPTKQLLAETDGPTALEWVSGNYGMPSEIKRVYQDICKLKNISIEEFKNHCSKKLEEILR